MTVEGNGLVWRDWDGCGRPVIGVEGLGWLWKASDWCGGIGMSVDEKGLVWRDWDGCGGPGMVQETNFVATKHMHS